MKKLLFLLVIITSFCYSQEEKLSIFLDFGVPLGILLGANFDNCFVFCFGMKRNYFWNTFGIFWEGPAAGAGPA